MLILLPRVSVIDFYYIAFWLFCELAKKGFFLCLMVYSDFLILS